MCSERIVDLARERLWTNVSFTWLNSGIQLPTHSLRWRERLSVQVAMYIAGADSTAIRNVPVPGSVAEKPAAGNEWEDEKGGGDHPFDDVVDDGYACQGRCQLEAGFGDCDLLVYPDGDDGPSDEQRELFDTFIASEARWLPLLQRKLTVALRKAVADGRIALAEPVPATVAEFSNIGRWIERPEVSVEAQEGKTEGLVGISYSIRGTDWTVNARIRPGDDSPDQLVRVSIHHIGECEADGELVQTGPDQYELVVIPKQEQDEGEEEATPGI
jgi:hypothetical protein